MATTSDSTIAFSAFSIASAAAFSQATRCATVDSRLARYAACAFFTAASMTAASESATCATSFSSIGEMSGVNFSSADAVAPPIQG